MVRCWPTWGEKGDAGVGPVLPHLIWQNPGHTPEVQVSGDAAGLDGHQVAPHTCKGGRWQWAEVGKRDRSSQICIHRPTTQTTNDVNGWHMALAYTFGWVLWITYAWNTFFHTVQAENQISCWFMDFPAFNSMPAHGFTRTLLSPSEIFNNLMIYQINYLIASLHSRQVWGW